MFYPKKINLFNITMKRMLNFYQCMVYKTYSKSDSNPYLCNPIIKDVSYSKKLMDGS